VTIESERSTETSWSWSVSLGLFAIATISEFLGLFYWRQWFASGKLLAATLVLWGGFAVERAVVVIWLQLPGRLRDPFGTTRPLWLIIALVTVAEIVTWVLWIRFTGGFVVGALLLAVGIHIVHAYEVAVIRRTGYVPAAVDFGTLVLTVLEAGGAAVWLAWTLNGRAVAGTAALFASLLAISKRQSHSRFDVFQYQICGIAAAWGAWWAWQRILRESSFDSATVHWWGAYIDAHGFYLVSLVLFLA